jgi:hypothetical protein
MTLKSLKPRSAFPNEAATNSDRESLTMDDEFEPPVAKVATSNAPGEEEEESSGEEDALDWTKLPYVARTGVNVRKTDKSPRIVV